MHETIIKAQNGDRSAMTEIYNITCKELLYYCLKLCGNENDAEDLLQDTYLTVFEKLSQYRRNKNFKGWLHTIAFHKYYNKIRDEKPYLWIESGEIQENESEIPDIQKYVEDKEVYSAVINIISEKLSEPQRITVLLYYYDEKSLAEIAHECECSEGTVKSRLYYSRKLLREELEKSGYYFGAGIPMLGEALKADSALFISNAAGTVVLSSAAVIGNAVKRSAVKSILSFTKGKLISGAAVIAITGGAAAIHHAVSNNQEISDSQETSYQITSVATDEQANELLTKEPVKEEFESETEWEMEDTMESESMEMTETETSAYSELGDAMETYDFPLNAMKVSIPENYVGTFTSRSSTSDDRLSSRDQKMTDLLRKDHKYLSSRYGSLYFKPDEFSGDYVKIMMSNDENAYMNLNEAVLNIYEDALLESSEEIMISVDNTNKLDAPLQNEGKKSKFTADIDGCNAVITAVSFQHMKKSYVFIFVDCSNSRQSEYENIIGSIVLRYFDNSWRDDYPGIDNF